MATAAGVTQAVFPEGGLSRDGRLRPPKLGILDYMLRAFDPKEGRDIVFVPTGINYDRTFEDRSFLIHRGTAVQRRGAATNTFGFVMRNLWLIARNRWHRFGYACVNFGSPISLRGWVEARGIDFRTLGKEERSRRLEELASELMEAVARVIPALPVSLVATIVVRSLERGFSELELKAAALSLMESLEARGAHVYVPRGDQDYAIAVGLRMLTLRRLVVSNDGIYRVASGQMPLLEYYAHAIAHLVDGAA